MLIEYEASSGEQKGMNWAENWNSNLKQWLSISKTAAALLICKICVLKE